MNGLDVVMNRRRLLAGTFSVGILAAACSQPAASPTAAPAKSQPAPTAAPPKAAAAKATQPAAKSAPAAKPAPVSINYGIPVVSSLYWHLFVGEEKGIYADEGIDFKRTFVQQGYPAIAQGVVAGAYQLSSLSSDTAVPAIINGADLQYVSSEMHMPVFSIISQKHIKSFDDVKDGTRIGVASIHGGTSEVLRVIFNQKGKKEGTDYVMIQAGSTSQRVAGLKSNSIDLGLMGQPQDMQMEDDGYTNLGLTTDFVKDFGFAETWVKPDWAKANQDVVVRFIRAQIKAIDWLYDPKNKQEAVKMLSTITKTAENYSERTYDLLIVKLKAFVPKAEPSAASVDSAIKILTDTGALKDPKVTGAKITDTSYWQKARDSLKGS